METLVELFDKYKGIPKTFIDGLPAEWGGDKGSAHSYIETYDKLFSGLRDKSLFVMEIGVLYGSSMFMWRDYFPNSIIYGMDVLEQCKKYEEDRIKIFISDSTDSKVVGNVLGNLKFDIIIDDGYHDLDKQLSTFNSMFKYLNDGGIYVIEDVQRIDLDRKQFLSLHPNVEVVDLRYVKGKYDDVLVVIRK